MRRPYYSGSNEIIYSNYTCSARPPGGRLCGCSGGALRPRPGFSSPGRQAAGGDTESGLYLQRDGQGVQDRGGRAEPARGMGWPPEAHAGRAVAGQRPGLHDSGGLRRHPVQNVVQHPVPRVAGDRGSDTGKQEFRECLPASYASRPSQYHSRAI